MFHTDTTFNDQMNKSKITSTRHHSSTQHPPQLQKCSNTNICSWKKIVNADLDSGRDILLEVDTGNPLPSDLKDVQAVELVIAVQSAIKQRQQLIEEWKNKTVTLTDQVEKLQKEKYSLEKDNIVKDSELENMAKKLNDLQKQYKCLSFDCGKLKKELDCLRCDYETLLNSYNSAVKELNETKRRLADAVELERSLQRRIHEQMNLNDNKDCIIKQLERELEESRRHITNLTCSLDGASKELLGVKHTLGDYKQFQSKLCDLKQNYTSLKDKYSTLELELNKETEENSSLREVISKLNLTIETLNCDKNELILAVQCLNAEKNNLVERNAKLVRDLNHAKQNFFNVQREMKQLQSEVTCLREKVQDLESCNVALCNELDTARYENKNLNNNLQKTIGECATLSKALSESQCQLEQQQKALLNVEKKVKRLLEEKQNLQNLLNDTKEENMKSFDELNRMNHENGQLKNLNSDLTNKLNTVTIELNENIHEINRLNKEIDHIRAVLCSEKEKHEKTIIKLQEKIQEKSQKWKEYVTNEIERLRNKRRCEINKYLEMNRDLENRINLCQESKNSMEEHLNGNIIELTTQLDICRHKLEETIYKAKQERIELIEKANSDNSKLMDKLNKQRMESQWLVTELEAKIQELVQKNLDDDSTIKLLYSENEQIKIKVKELEIDNSSLNKYKSDINSLLDTKHALEVELNNCRNLLKLAEETVVNVRNENDDILKKFQREEESLRIVQNKIIKLKKIIGKKDAQIDVLQNTIVQLKEQISHTNDENIRLKSTINELENNQNELVHKLQDLNQSLTTAKNEINSHNDDKKNLVLVIKKIEKEIRQLESENLCLKNELQMAKDTQYMSDKALEHSHLVQTELKDKLVKMEANAAKSACDTRHLEIKVNKMKEYISKLENDLQVLNESYQYSQSQNKYKMEELTCQLTNANDEIYTLKGQLEKSEKRIAYLKKSLKESDKSLQALTNVFDRLREVVCQVLEVSYVPVSICPHEDTNLDASVRQKQYIDVIQLYSTEVDGYIRGLEMLKKNETELHCKLVNTKKDFEKLSNVMKELQNDYSLKVDKLYAAVKEKDEMIKNLERQVVKAQLEAADVDDNLINSLKLKIEDQQNHIKRLQQEKASLQDEILCLSKKINEMEGSIFELVEKIKTFENKNSKLQVKNVSLEGELEKLTLLLKEARDKEKDQLCQFKQMMLANRELMEKVRNLKIDLENEAKEVNNLRKAKFSEQAYDKHSRSLCKQSCSEKELELEVKMLTEKLAHSQRAEQEAKSALKELDENICGTKKQLSVALSEKANLEGWVSHLQHLISGGYIADSNLPQQLSKAEEEKTELQQTLESLKHNYSVLNEDKKHLKQTVENLTKCNKNLETTITAISKNKESLEKELNMIQNKFESLYQGVKSSESDVSEFYDDISFLLKKAYSMTKSIKCSQNIDDYNDCERRITAGVKTVSYPPTISADESIESISVTVGCKTAGGKSESTHRCCIKGHKIENDTNSHQMPSYCRKCSFIEMKHNETTENANVSRKDSKLSRNNGSQKSDKKSRSFV